MRDKTISNSDNSNSSNNSVFKQRPKSVVFNKENVLQTTQNIEVENVTGNYHILIYEFNIRT